MICNVISAKEKRYVAKSPERPKKQCKTCKTGVGHLENGQPYVDFWPTKDRPPVNVRQVSRQSVEDSATWIKQEGLCKTSGGIAMVILQYKNLLETNP